MNTNIEFILYLWAKEVGWMHCAVENYKKLKGDDAGALYSNGIVETKTRDGWRESRNLSLGFKWILRGWVLDQELGAAPSTKKPGELKYGARSTRGPSAPSWGWGGSGWVRQLPSLLWDSYHALRYTLEFGLAVKVRCNCKIQNGSAVVSLNDKRLFHLKTVWNSFVTL